LIDIEINNVTSIANGASAYPEVMECLNTWSPGYQYTYLYKVGRWNGKVSLFKGEEFPTGLVEALYDHIVRLKIPCNVKDNRVIRPVYLQETTVNLRDYQEEIIKKCIHNTYGGTWWPRGVIQVATGGGKTEMAAALIQIINVPTIFLVHRQDLQTQAIERFKPYGIDVGTLDTIGQNLVTVTTIQSLMSWNMSFDKVYTQADGTEVERDDKWMKKKEAKQSARAFELKSRLLDIQQVFIDEAHLVAAVAENMNMFSTALSLMPNAYCRWGLTATPFLRDKLHNWMLEGATGPVIAQITNRELIDMGYLSEAFVDIFVMPKSHVLPNDWPRCYDYGIVTNRVRNEQIVKCFATYPGPTLILVNKLGHGTLLEKMVQTAGFNLPFVHGSTSQSERQKVIKLLKSGRLNGAIVSTIWDEGLDIPNLGTIILAGGGKSEIKNLQRLGRGLRVADGKANLRLVDFQDTSPAILKKHSTIREKIWEDQGFTLNYVRPT
jgi:superfamily II DNA or RNA helicase